MTSLGASGLEYANNDSSMWTVAHAPYGHGHERPEEVAVPVKYAARPLPWPHFSCVHGRTSQL